MSDKDEDMRDKGLNDKKREASIESIGGKQSPARLSQLAVQGSIDQVGPQDAISDDEIVHSEREFYVDKEEESLHATTNDDTLRDDSVKHSSKKQNLMSQVPQALSQEIDDGEDSRTASS